MNAGFTARAQAAVSKSHGLYTSVDLLQNGVVVAADIPIDETTAAVQVDGSAAVRRTFSATISNPSAWKLTPTSLLSPFMTEVQAWSGIRYPDGTFDRWSVFVGGLEDPKINDTDADLDLTITASDRAQSVSEHRLPVAYVAPNPARPLISGPTTVYVHNVIQDLINFVRPGISFLITLPPLSNLTITLPLVIAELEDPWQHAQEMAAAFGLECFFNSDGVCVIQPIPDPNTSPVVWTFAEGVNAMITAVGATLTAKESYSHAVVIGQSVNGAAPVRSDQYDTDSSSPTYYLGPFGDRPVGLSSDFITTQVQADAAGIGLLARKKGAVQNVTLTHVPITALDEHDVVYVSRGRLGINAAFVLDAFTIPLDASNEMSPTLRSRRI